MSGPTHGEARAVLSTDLGTLHQGDCLAWLPTVADACVDVVFADPPFNLDKDYGAGVTDRLDDAEYLAWCEQWLRECARVLKPGGALWLYHVPRWNIELGHVLNGLGLTFRHWVAVDLKMSLPIQGRLYPSHYSLLYYTRGKPGRFERPRLPVETCRHCGGDVKDYGGHRAKLHPDGINLSDVWTDITPVRHRGTKNRGPNQLSEKLLERVLTISTEPGDVVLDPFGGSGTTFAVAERMHRHWAGIELGDVDPIVRRLTGQETAYEPPGRGDAGKGVRSADVDGP
ncbi:DNA-methyltransferase [Nocardioides bruguierae]|uniref:DNA-methyltransferase n=1 Tax=Nocardioides bruguierae TaxID=2945102 RepID=UPI002020FE17|nr:site-specific DNA-methyltransferase [Nocardioides bruguierae]MCL8025651.1 site-specific DNA-methyltransferase [Nocardioides bruguierae]